MVLLAVLLVALSEVILLVVLTDEIGIYIAADYGGNEAEAFNKAICAATD